VGTTGDDAVLSVKDDNVLQLEKAGVLPWLAFMFPLFLTSLVD
jgi:hypothetical protein